MTDWVLGISLKTVVFLLMLFVGLDCTLAGMRDSIRRPLLLLTATATQFIIIPLVAVLLCGVLRLPHDLSGAILLTACSSSGAISNTYTFMARGNSAFSIAMTVWSCLLSFVGTPLALWILQRISTAEVAQSLDIPLAPVFQQLLLMLVLPVFLGLLVRALAASRVIPHLGKLRVLSGVLVVALIALIEVSTSQPVLGMAVQVLVPALLLALILAGIGYLLGMLFKRPFRDVVALAYEWPCRNLAVVAIIGVTVLERPDLVLFATAFFVAQAVLLLGSAVVIGRIRR